MASGRKILWKLYSNPRHLVSQILRKKYHKGVSLRNLQAENTSKCTLIWNLCRRELDFFQKHLYHILEMGKNDVVERQYHGPAAPQQF
jgi:hypothetical protein